MAKIRPIMKIAALVVMGSLVLSACSKKLPEETTPSTVATEATTTVEVVETEATEETTVETEPAETEPSHGPFSTAVVTDRVVDINGMLSVKDGTLVNQDGDPIQLRGMSSYGMQAVGNFFNEAAIQTLAEDWGCTVIRFAMYTVSEGNGEAYIRNPDKYFQMMCECIDLCIDQGVYCIVDWHILGEGDPMERKEEALDFFSRISAIYGDCPNIIYELCNEPNGKCFDNPDEIVSWEKCIKPYAEEIIPAIRENSPNNIIVVGTPNWCQHVDEVVGSPITGYDNIMYSLHFYAASHGQDIRDRADIALAAGLPIFCTEWGTTSDSGGGTVNTEASDEWMVYLKEHNISWCNWSIGGPNAELSNALKFQSKVLTIEEKYLGHWPDEFISRSGYYVRCQILEIPYEPLEG
ncbi:MAG: glycoside hydrolase family 5 protein [Clostridia bacterium]|nr:glycoside hydrolase family 5 protein [Clostridia bacterium]